MDNLDQTKSKALPIAAESKNDAEHRPAAAEVDPQLARDPQAALREALRSLPVERDTAPPSMPSGPATGPEGQGAIDNAMLIEIEGRREVRLDQSASREADELMAKADVSAFKRIED